MIALRGNSAHFNLKPRITNMTSAAPQDGGSNLEHLKDKLKNPFNEMREKFRDSKLYDLKVGLIHKK
jgi:phospholipase D1/2